VTIGQIAESARPNAPNPYQARAVNRHGACTGRGIALQFYISHHWPAASDVIRSESSAFKSFDIFGARYRPFAMYGVTKRVTEVTKRVPCEESLTERKN
jgi:hypothetical protein